MGDRISHEELVLSLSRLTLTRHSRGDDTRTITPSRTVPTLGTCKKTRPSSVACRWPSLWISASGQSFAAEIDGAFFSAW